MKYFRHVCFQMVPWFTKIKIKKNSPSPMSTYFSWSGGHLVFQSRKKSEDHIYETFLQSNNAITHLVSETEIS